MVAELIAPETGARLGRVTLRNPMGLHMRPATTVTNLAKQFSGGITLRAGERQANAKSMMDLLLLAVEQGTELTVMADGPDADAAIAALVEFLGCEDMDQWHEGGSGV